MTEVTRVNGKLYIDGYDVERLKAYTNAWRTGNPHDRATAAIDVADAEMAELREQLSKLEELIRREHTIEEGMMSDMGGQDIVHYCGGCGVDLGEEDCPYLAILDGGKDDE